MTFQLRDKSVLVTGGTGVLGTAVVSALLAEGGVCHVATRDAGTNQSEGRLITHQVDLLDEASVSAMYEGIDGLWASIHVAGGFAMAPIEKTSGAEMRKMFDLNTMTVFHCCKSAVTQMRKNGKTGGRIVNVAARPAVTPTPGMIAYATSKAAATSITQSLAEELRAEGILVNAVLPSLMDSPANRAAMPDADHNVWPKAEEVARAILFLASPLNALTTGSLMPVYGKV
mgnify:FL=1